MGTRDGGLIPDTDVGRPAIAGNAEADAAALLAAGRELISEARRILAEPLFDTPTRSADPAFYRSSLEEDGATARVERGSRHRLTRRLVAVVPAAAGVALLGAGVAAVAGGHTDHALAVTSQRNSTSAPRALAAPAAIDSTGPAIQVPLSLSVPRQHSEASVAQEVYVQTSGPESGLLNAPSDYHQLGWYRHGDSGVLVLDGHVGYRNDPGPLAFIGSLRVGDDVILRFPSGPQTFSVRVVGKAPKGQLPQEYFSGQYDQDLMLLTCDYTSPFSAGHFADNVYVVAVPNQ